jgi:hypothetical protein
MCNCLLFDDLFFVIYCESVLDTKLYSLTLKVILYKSSLTYCWKLFGSRIKFLLIFIFHLWFLLHFVFPRKQTMEIDEIEIPKSILRRSLKLFITVPYSCQISFGCDIFFRWLTIEKDDFEFKDDNQKLRCSQRSLFLPNQTFQFSSSLHLG